MNRKYTRILFSFFVIIFWGFKIQDSYAQIGLVPTDTTVCPGTSYTIHGSFASIFNVTDSTDDYFGVQTVNIGFPFIFYGDTVTQLVISTNNFISFDLTLAGQYSYWFYQTALTAGQLNDAIMFPFQDVDFSTASVNPNPGVISYQTFGSAPNRKFVLEFCSVPLFGCSTLLTTSELVLYEGSNNIDIYIGDKEICSTWPQVGGPTGPIYPGSAIEGLRHGSNQNLVSGRNNDTVGWSATDDGRRFTPNGTNSYTISTIPYNPVPILQNVTTQNIMWYKAGDTTSIGTDSSINVTTNANVPYYVAQVSGYSCNNDTLLLFSDTSWVHFHTKYDTLHETICSDNSYSFGGQNLTTAGTYVDSLTSSSGCDSVVTLFLSLNPSYHDTLTESICQGTSYSFNGHNYTLAGNYTDSLQTVAGCDSFIILHLTVNPIVRDTFSVGICPGSSYTFNGQNYTAAGFYTDTFQTVIGCDSLSTLDLDINSVYNDTIVASICQGTSYSFGGQNYTSAGTYTDTFQSVTSCDSIVTVNLSVNLTQYFSLADTICSGGSYLFGNHNLTTAGTYSDTLSSMTGCDSIVTLTLTVNSSFRDTLVADICAGSSYSFYGQSHSSSGFYTHTLQSVTGCDSVIILHLKVNPIAHDTFSVGICPGSNYSFNGHNYTTAGFYTDTAQSVAGCDSFETLHLTINSTYNDTIYANICAGSSYSFNGQNDTVSGTYNATFQSVLGCDSTVTLFLTVHPNESISIVDTICSYETYLFHGQNLNTSGIYTETLTSATGCDSTVTLTLTVLPSLSDTIRDSICNGSNYVFNGQSYAASGFYVDTFQTAGSCDSFEVLHLTVNPTYNDTLFASICPGSSYTFNGQTYSTAGFYTDTAQSVFGCDSTVTLHLTINPIYNDTISESICQGSSYTFGDTNYSTAGFYAHTFQTVGGCDSVVSLHLTVLPNQDTTVSDTICSNDSYLFGNQNLTTAGTYTDTFSSSTGCDSVVTLHLAVNPAYSDTVVANICSGSSYSFNGQNYSISGFYSHTFQTITSCDSTITLHLIVNPVYNDTLTENICAGSSYNFNGQNDTIAGFYTATLSTVHGCDSTVTLHLLVNPIYHDTVTTTICQGTTYVIGSQNYTATGIYTDTLQTIMGCDSIITLDLTVTPILNTAISASICEGDDYFFAGQNLHITGIYADTLTSVASGCDSIVTLTLTVHAPSKETVLANICQGATYSFDNQTLTTSGIYADTFYTIYGCDSVVTLALTVNPVFNDTITEYICQGSSYLFDNQNYSVAGNYTDTFSTVQGCDSIVTLNLIVNPTYQDTLSESICPGSSYDFNNQNYSVSGFYTDTFSTVYGCDSLTTLHLIINSVYDDTIPVSICPNSSYTFNGQIYSVAGFYTDSLQTVMGCDSVVILHLSVTPVILDTLSATICPESSYDFNGQNYTATGFYTDTFQSVAGCDSIVTLSLTVNPVYNDTISATICEGSSYLFNNQNYSVAGFYTDTLSTIMGCDSIVVLHLHLNPTYSDTVVATICQGSTYSFNSQNYTITGLYTDTFQTVLGCDSFEILHLTVYPVYHDTFSETICQGSSYVFNNQNYSVAGFYAHTFQTVHGCDSVVTLHLIVNPSYHDTFSANICPGSSYSFNGQNYSTAGFYTDSFQTVLGCDSIVTLNLIVNPTYNDTIGANICQGSSYSFNNQNYTTAGFYTDSSQTALGCDSVITLNLTVYPVYNDTFSATICQGASYSFNSQSYSTSGFYSATFQTIHGCDSSVTLHLFVNPVFYDTTTASICPGSSYSFNGHAYTSSGNHTDTLQAVTGCDSFVTLSLSFYPVYNDTVHAYICFGSAYQLNGQNYSATGNYIDTLTTIHGCDSVIHLFLQVSDPPQDDTINTMGCGHVTFEGNNYTQNTQLHDTLFNSHGCDSVYRTINITVWTPVVVNKDSSGCEIVYFKGRSYDEDTVISQHFIGSHGCDSFILNTHIHILHSVKDTVQANICKGTNYFFNGNQLGQSGTYAAVFPRGNGCDSTSILMLTVHDSPDVQITVEPTLNGYCLGDEITLHGNGAARYLWWMQGEQDTVNADEMHIVLNLKQSIFFVVGQDQWDCVDTAHLELDAGYCTQIFVPNAFSPNGDGRNDKFGVEMNGHPTAFRMEIFNRYGQLIFVGYQPDDHWDGTFNGQPVDVGVYYYYITGVYRDGTPFNKKGSLTLIR